jgi:membrane-bound lytic murein transglycosylase D
MKKFFTVTICSLLFNIIYAGTPVFAGIANRNTSGPGDTTGVTKPVGYYANSIFKLRLDSITRDVPLDYNEYVQTYIDTYSRHKDEMSKVLGLAKYYFPIYEKAFRETGIPEEIKYLSIVESKLDPTAVSRVGATGPWQFMAATAKMYGLNMDGYIDERRDPVRASYAAAAYLKDAYMEFGDWLLAIASYNCGKSNVERAIEKAGALDFWAIRQYLPVETRNYVPAYIAVAYVMNYAKNHDIEALPWNFAKAGADTVMVNRFVSLSNVSKALNVDLHQLSLLNPAYTRQIINGSNAIPRKLVIPVSSNETYNALYAVLNEDGVVAEPSPVYTPYKEAPVHKMPESHVVKRGETLAEIADRYGVELQDLKDWNNIRGSKAVAGKKLWLNDMHQSSAQQPDAKRDLKVIQYKVKPGDTLKVIAAKFYGCSVEDIRTLNGLTKDDLQPGMLLKISKG